MKKPHNHLVIKTDTHDFFFLWKTLTSLNNTVIFAKKKSFGEKLLTVAINWERWQIVVGISMIFSSSSRFIIFFECHTSHWISDTAWKIQGRWFNSLYGIVKNFIKLGEKKSNRLFSDFRRNLQQYLFCKLSVCYYQKLKRYWWTWLFGIILDPCTQASMKIHTFAH